MNWRYTHTHIACNLANYAREKMGLWGFNISLNERKNSQKGNKP